MSKTRRGREKGRTVRVDFVKFEGQTRKSMLFRLEKQNKSGASDLREDENKSKDKGNAVPEVQPQHWAVKLGR